MFSVLVVMLALSPPAAGGQLIEPLRPLQFFIGSCWTGTFPGGNATDTHCFEPVFDGKFVRDRHVVRGGKTPYEGETLYAWNVAGKQVVYTYWASDGAMSTGTMEPGEGELLFPESHSGEGGATRMRNVWRITGKDTYDVIVSRWKDGDWREMWRMTMRRAAAAPPRGELPSGQLPSGQLPTPKPSNRQLPTSDFQTLSLRLSYVWELVVGPWELGFRREAAQPPSSDLVVGSWRSWDLSLFSLRPAPRAPSSRAAGRSARAARRGPAARP